MKEIIMGYQGEMSLKGLNRNQFESAMMKILRYRLKTVGKFKVYCTQSTYYMEPEEEDEDMDQETAKLLVKDIKDRMLFLVLLDQFSKVVRCHNTEDCQREVSNAETLRQSLELIFPLLKLSRMTQ